MAKFGAQPGNKNASKENRIVGDTLKRIAVQNRSKLRAACEKLLDQAVEGDIQSFKEFADRVDGKSIQQVATTGTGKVVALIIDG